MSWQETISRTGFLTSVTAYVSFWLLDVLRPGFVARYLSVHVFLVATVVFGLWWLRSVREYCDRPVVQYAAAAAFGILSAWVVWELGTGFGDFRLIAVVLAALVPATVLAVVRRS
jgi:hypothetical protein